MLSFKFGEYTFPMLCGMATFHGLLKLDPKLDSIHKPYTHGLKDIRYPLVIL